MRLVRRQGLSGGWGGRVGLSLFFGVFLAVGLIFEILIVRSVAQNAVTYLWTEVPCIIEESVLPPADAVETSAGWQVRYRYEFGGRAYVASEISRGMSSRDASDELRLSQRFSSGTGTTCFVNPRDPAEAVLLRGSLWTVVLVLFPLIFIGVGAGGIWAVWWRKPAEGLRAPQSRPPVDRSRIVGVGFFGIFLLVGMGLSYVFLLRPVARVLAARAWVEMPCEIISSEVEQHSGDAGPTYAVRITYQYVIDGRTLLSDRFRFAAISSSGYRAKADTVAQFPPGRQTQCFVNPADPTDAVIERGLTAELWWGAIPFVFVLVGAGGMIASWRSGPSRAPPRHHFLAETGKTPAVLPADTVPSSAEGPVRLVARSTPIGRLVGSAIFALFWNGLIAFFLWQIIGESRRSTGNWFMVIFLLPFVGVGIFVLFQAIRSALALANPRPILTASRAALVPGDVLAVTWTIAGRVGRLRRLRVFLEGREEARYRRGTNTHTDTHVFTTFDLINTTDPAAIASGLARLELPPGLMHSFEAPNNKILWLLRMQGEIPRWPDIEEEFPFVVLPRSPST